MKKKDLLHLINQDLLDRIFGFCYARTANSYEAQELCSDIVYALLRSAQTDGEIETPTAFIWRVARNTYADFAEQKKKRANHTVGGDPEEILRLLTDEDDSAEREEDREQLRRILRQIGFLTRAYREVMIAYYLDGQPVAAIARTQNATENTIRQRLFSAREQIRKGVQAMERNKPLALQPLHFMQWGTGNPLTGNPWERCNRLLSKHVVWLCRNQERSAKEISETLNTPMPYIEEELEIQRNQSGYGLLRKLDNGKYTTNFVLLSREEIEAAHTIYIDRIPMICDTVADYIQAHKDDYLAFPYLNKHVDLNLILWQQIHSIGHIFSNCVNAELRNNHFADIPESKRPYSVFGYEYFDGPAWGGGWDGIHGKDLLGYSYVHLSNIYIKRIQAHFHCGHNISLDEALLLTIRAIEGLDVNSLTENEKEVAAKAIQCGYLYREGDTLYTKILVHREADNARIFDLNEGLKDSFQAEARIVAKEIATLIRQILPEHLLPDWRLANSLAALPILDSLVDSLIERGLLTPPDNGIGAEGCWMYLQK